MRHYLNGKCHFFIFCLSFRCCEAFPIIVSQSQTHPTSFRVSICFSEFTLINKLTISFLCWSECTCALTLSLLQLHYKLSLSPTHSLFLTYSSLSLSLLLSVSLFCTLKPSLIHTECLPTRYKSGPSSASSFFIFCLFKQTIQILQQRNVKNVHAGSGAGIQT